MEESRTYLCIDLKSFYASVECAERGLDPFTTNLVVADPERTQTTICLAITPAMKELGIPNRCRVYEIPKDVHYIMARPRMRTYMEVSAKIYSVYLRYLSPEDIHVYSIDECFMDVTSYLSLYNKTAKELAVMLMDAVMKETGICATAGIGTNLFLAKVALDITAKHVDDHIGYLDEELFKEQLWHHRPITDIWNIGPGIARRLEKLGARDLFGVTRLDTELLFKEFGVNAQLIIDHAWGVEPCTMAEIKAYKPQSTSMTNGQLLPSDYSFEEGLMILREMVDSSVLELVEKQLVTNHLTLAVAYAQSKDGGAPAAPTAAPAALAASADAALTATAAAPAAAQPRTRWGHEHAGASRKLPEYTNSFKKLMAAVEELYYQNVDRSRAIRRVNISFGNLQGKDFATYNLFTDMAAEEKERDLQHALINVKQRFGKNAVMKGTSYQDKATGLERNEMVGGHHG